MTTFEIIIPECVQAHFGLILTCFVAIIVFLIVALIWFICRDDSWSVAADRMRNDYLEVDEMDDGISPNDSGIRIVRLTVAHLRAELGLLTDNTANRLVVSHAARRFMKEHGLRPTHVAKYFTFAIEAYMMRSVSDEWLDNVRESRRGRQLRRLGAKSM